MTSRRPIGFEPRTEPRRRLYTRRRLYIGHYAVRGSLVTARLVPRIADQRLARTEQQDQKDAKHAENRENRLFQDHPDDRGPEPWRLALHPGVERLLAGLVNIVPELAELGEPQGLVGDPARAVIDHEDESAGQQQQPHKSEETADHASPIPGPSSSCPIW